MKIFVVIPVHNRLEYTRACLDMLRAQSFRDFTTIVVDSDSRDGTPELVAAEYAEAVLLGTDSESWWTGATNLGVEWALRRGGPDDMVLTLNNDTIFGPSYLASLVASARQCPGAIVGSLVVHDRDGRTIVDGGVRINWFTGRYLALGRGEDALRVESRGLVASDALSGCGTLIPLPVFADIGLYAAQELPHYAADYEFTLRARRRGVGVFVDYRTRLITMTQATGIHASPDSADLPTFLRSFWDIRSANSLRHRFNFARLACPRSALPTFLVLDTLRVVGGALRRRYLDRRSDMST